jgi:hypothetical protein|tara:strand:- start:179 stop:967 length:789 start_codon:yes stop_codon:yes gene_type:complete
MIEKGWIKLHRSFLDWEWYSDRNVRDLFLHCLLKANHTEKNWRGNTIKRGTFYTSINNLSAEIGISAKACRIALDKLIGTGELTSQGASRGTTITVCNYDIYQSKEEPKGERQGELGGELTASQGQAKGELGATTKNDKNIKNDKNAKKKKAFAPPSFDELKIFVETEKLNCDPEAFIDHFASIGWKVGKGGHAMKDWQAAARGWSKRQDKWKERDAAKLNRKEDYPGQNRGLAQGQIVQFDTTTINDDNDLLSGRLSEANK